MRSEFKEKLYSLEEIFNIKIGKLENFEMALTHPSYTRENELNSLHSYERLEFLGDAVLKLCVSEILYKNFPKYAEGDLTKIRSIVVSDNILAQIAEKIELNKLLVLGKQEEKTGGRAKNSILACAFESILGAYYLDGKYLELSKALENIFEPFIKDADEHFEKFNAKAILQEHTQSVNKKTPEYRIIEENGPEHDKIFVVEVAFNEEILAVGEGSTKRKAEQDCAYKACVKLGVIK